LLCPRNPIQSKSEAIQLRITSEDSYRELRSNAESMILISTLLASGFHELPVPQFSRVQNYLVDTQTLRMFMPCPLGTFSNYSSQGAEGCIPCPPGMSSVFMTLSVPIFLN